jgi:hypothetical protein
VDVTKPILSLSNVTVPQTIPDGAVVNYTGSATDETSPANPSVRCVPASGSTFPIGTTTVKCFAVDDQGNAAFGNFDVTVTAAPGGNLLLKPDFGGAFAFPFPWVPFGIRGSSANALDCTIYQSAPCSVIFRGSRLNIYQAALQRLTRSGFAGDKYSFGLSSRADSVPASGKYRVELLYYDRYYRILGTSFVDFNIGTHGFEMANSSVVAPVNYARLGFRLVYQKMVGTAWFDDAFLYAAP